MRSTAWLFPFTVSSTITLSPLLACKGPTCALRTTADGSRSSTWKASSWVRVEHDVQCPSRRSSGPQLTALETEMAEIANGLAVTAGRRETVQLVTAEEGDKAWDARWSRPGNA